MRPGYATTPLVAKRIEELQARNERKAEMAALTRDELIAILTEIVMQPARVCQRLVRGMASKPRRCSPRCVVGTNQSKSISKGSR